jgi:hypothetical protein
MAMSEEGLCMLGLRPAVPEADGGVGAPLTALDATEAVGTDAAINGRRQGLCRRAPGRPFVSRGHVPS